MKAAYLILSFLAAAFTPMSVAFASDEGELTLIDDASVHVIRINAPYTLKSEAKFGSVWVAIGDAISVDGRKVSDGDAKAIPHGKTLNFTCAPQKKCEMIVVRVKKAEQDLTITTDTMDVKGGFDDASMRNKTLIVAVSNLKLRDVLDVGDEDHPKLKKPVVITMERGEVRWLPEGMHKVSNLSQQAAKYALIEW